MPSDISITSLSNIFAATAAAFIGCAAIWSNPKRRINRVFFSASLHVAIWLVLRYLANAGEDLMLYRATTALGAILHFHLWLIKETVADSDERFRIKFIRGKMWLICGLVLSAICFTEWFIPTPIHQTGDRNYGFGFTVFVVGLFVLFVALCIDTFREIRIRQGAQRLELQLLLVGGSSTAILVIMLMVARSLLNLAWVATLVPCVILTFYAATVIAITTSRVFDARQIVLFVVHRASLVILISLIALLGVHLFSGIVHPLFLIVIIVVASLSISNPSSRALAAFLKYLPKVDSARHAALAVAQQERSPESLHRAFSDILCGWGQSEKVLIMSMDKAILDDAKVYLNEDHLVMRAMRILRWATPERFVRERGTEEGSIVAKFLMDKQLGVLVVQQGVALSVLVGVGPGPSRRPYTYPHVTQLMELASIIGGAVERAHFSAKVQHTEQLATVGLLGASLAHEIRNPLVSLKTFVQLLPTHYQDVAFRDKFFRLILDEVNRIDQLTDQLLDLASPRTYISQEIDIHEVIRAGLDLVAAKAAHRQVELRTDFKANPNTAYTDSSAAKQVMLNLYFNAIQAIDNHGCVDRWIRIATRNTKFGIEVTVADSGPGISPDIFPRLFQPFQTTKSTGFGLGLAICRDILANLHATIAIDPPEPGCGATFRVTFPCQL